MTISASAGPGVSRVAAAEPGSLTGLSARRLADLVGREISAVEVAQAHLARVEQVEPWTRALVHVDRADVLAQAREIDARRAAGRKPADAGLLAGVPVVVKDNIDVCAQPTTSGSKAGGGPARVDSDVTRRLRLAGALVLGRSHMDELALGASTQTSAFGRTHNPHDVRRSPGGSSGGSAAAVAAQESTLGVGTDTGGSIREPASQCGVVGMAPSPGVVPMRGVVPFAPGLDRVGPLSRDVPDAALLLAVLGDRAGLAHTTDDPDVRGLRVGVLAELAPRATTSGCWAGSTGWSRHCSGWAPRSCPSRPRRPAVPWPPT